MQAKRVSSEKKAVEAYLSSHKIQDVMNNVVNQTLRERPADPMLMLSDLLREKSPSASDILQVRAHQIYDHEFRKSISVTVTTRLGSFSTDLIRGHLNKSISPEVVEEEGKEGSPVAVVEEDNEVDALVDVLNGSVASSLVGVGCGEDVDLVLQDTFTEHTSALASEASFALSAAISLSAAKSQNMPLCKFISAKSESESMSFPVPGVTVLKASDKGLWKSICVLPVGASSFKGAIETALAVKNRIEALPDLDSGMGLEEACRLVWEEGVVELKLEAEVKLGLTLDLDRLASCTDSGEEEEKSEELEDTDDVNTRGKTTGCQYRLDDATTLNGNDLIEMLSELINEKFAGHIACIVNPFDLSDVESYKLFHAAVGETVSLLSSAIVTDSEDKASQGGVVLQLSKAKNISELIEKRLLALADGLSTSISMIHESFGSDSILPHVALGLAVGLLFLDPDLNSCQSAINELLRLEAEFHAQALYVGSGFRDT